MMTPDEAAAELAHNTFDFVAVIPEGIGGHWARADTPESALRAAQKRTSYPRRKPARYYILTLRADAKIDFYDTGGFYAPIGSDLQIYEDHGCDVSLHNLGDNEEEPDEAAALQIVLDLARQNLVDATEMPEEYARQIAAINIVDDMISQKENTK